MRKSRYGGIWAAWAGAAALVAGGGAIGVAADADWLQWRGPNRQNHSPDQGINVDWNKTPPKLLWMGEGVGKGYSGVSLAGGKLFTTGNFEDGQGVAAVDAATGKILWKKSLTEKNPKHGYDGARCTPTIDGGRLYVVTSDGSVACLEAADGKVVWQRRFKEWDGKMMSGWGYSESPLIDGDRLICTPGGPQAMLVALDKNDGKEIWKSAPSDLGQNGKDGAGYASIVISEAAGVKQYVTIVGRGAIGVRASDGKFLWNYNRIANPTANIPTPLVKGDNVFVSTGYGTGSALLKLSAEGDGIKAEEVYFKKGDELQNHHGGMILVGDHVYLGRGHNNGFPTCIELADGKMLWGDKVRGVGKGSAATAFVDKHLIFRYQSGEIALIEATPTEYRLKGQFKPEYQEGESWAHPVIVNGKMYLREQNKIMCYSMTGE